MSFLEDGFATYFTFSSSSAAQAFFRERTVQPPGVQGGGEIDVTTMRNTTWRTRAAKQLKTLSNSQMSVEYDPKLYTEIVNAIGVNQLITITFPDTSELDFWGFLDEFTPGENTEGEFPSADCVVIPSNRNASQVETAPVFRDPTTTTTTTT